MLSCDYRTSRGTTAAALGPLGTGGAGGGGAGKSSASWKLSSDKLRVVFEYLPRYSLLVYLVKCLYNVYCVPGTGILVDLQRQSWQALAFCSQSTLTTNGHALLVQSKDSQRFRLSGLMWNALLQDMLWEKSQL